MSQKVVKEEEQKDEEHQELILKCETTDLTRARSHIDKLLPQRIKKTQMDFQTFMDLKKQSTAFGLEERDQNIKAVKMVYDTMRKD